MPRFIIHAMCFSSLQGLENHGDRVDSASVSGKPPQVQFFRRRKFSPPMSNRQSVLAAWRGVDLQPLEIAQKVAAESLGNLMPKVLGGLGLEKKQIEAEVFKAWPHMMSPDVAAHTQPSALKNGTLYVSVDSSAWFDEIQRFRRKEIMDRIQSTFGSKMVAKIFFKLG